MSRIFGFFWKEPRKEEENRHLLHKMASANRDSEHWNMESFCDGHTGIAQLTKKIGDPSSSFDLHSEALILKTGLVYSRCGDNKNKNEKGVDILTHYRERGSGLIEEIGGTFNVLIYDRICSKLNIYSDRYGYRCVYYYSDEKVTLYSTEIKFILSSGLVDKTINHSAIWDMFNFRFIIGNKTFLEKIHLLPHGHFLEVGPSGARQVKYWDYPQGPPETTFNSDHLLERGKELLERAIRRGTDIGDRPVVALSGGFDSRTILGFLTKSRSDVECFHIGYPEWGETKVATKLCKETGSKINIHDPSTIRYDDFLEEALYLSDGHLSIEQMDFFPFVRSFAQENPHHFMLDGFALDQGFHFYHFVTNSTENYSIDTVLRILRGYYNPLPDGLVDAIFSEETAKEIRNSANENIVQWAEAFDSDSLFELTQRFYCANRGRRYTAGTHRLSSFYLDYALPGLDYDLFDFCLGLSARDRIHGRTYKDLIEKYLPELAKYPHGKTGLSLKESPGGFYRFKKRVNHNLYYVGRLTHGRIDFLSPHDRNKKLRRDSEFRNFILNTLMDEKIGKRGIYKKNGIKNLIDLQMTGRNYAGLFLTAIQVESFFRNFVD